MLNGGNNAAVSKQVMILKDSLLKYEYENVLKLKKNPELEKQWNRFDPVVSMWEQISNIGPIYQ